ncbi:hypothetical protein AAVH_36996 [Aphelenchoides avenae]|nr:hypothetical protein AAVH_36996 [Aphelenchus avenae]
MTDKPMLYGYWMSSCTWRVRISLIWKGIDYEYISVDDPKSEAYLELNPCGKIPTLILDGKVFIESLAILEFLEEKFPDKRSLLPGNAEQRAHIRSLALQVIANIQPLQNPAVVKCLDESKQAEWPRHWIEVGFDALEKQLARSAGKYCVGDSVTLADVCLVPQVQNARRYGVDVARYPTIKRIDAALSELPEFQKAHISKLPDAHFE